MSSSSALAGASHVDVAFAASPRRTREQPCTLKWVHLLPNGPAMTMPLAASPRRAEQCEAGTARSRATRGAEHSSASRAGPRSDTLALTVESLADRDRFAPLPLDLGGRRPTWSASRSSPRSCMISTRSTRQSPVRDVSSHSAHHRQPSVHSLACRSSATSTRSRWCRSTRSPDHRRQEARTATTRSFVGKAASPRRPCPDFTRRPALLIPGQPRQVRVSEPLPDRRGLGSRRMARHPVTGGHLAQPHRNEQVSALDAVPVGGPGRRSPTPNHPSARAGRPRKRWLCPIHQVHRTAAGSPAGGQVRPVRALQRSDVLIVAAKHVRRPGQQLEILRLQRNVRICLGERRVGIPPLCTAKAARPSANAVAIGTMNRSSARHPHA